MNMHRPRRQNTAGEYSQTRCRPRWAPLKHVGHISARATGSVQDSSGLGQQTQKQLEELLVSGIAVHSPFLVGERCPQDIIALDGFASLLFEPLGSIHLVASPWPRRPITMVACSVLEIAWLGR